ncbi:MAG: hypothetical protein AB8G05_24390 [Oligoflexales bacterium]
MKNICLLIIKILSIGALSGQCVYASEGKQDLKKKAEDKNKDLYAIHQNDNELEEITTDEQEILELKKRYGPNNLYALMKIKQLQKRIAVRNYWRDLGRLKIEYQAKQNLEGVLGLKVVAYYEKGYQSGVKLEPQIRNASERYGRKIHELYSRANSKRSSRIIASIRRALNSSYLKPLNTDFTTKNDYTLFRDSYREKLEHLYSQIPIFQKEANIALSRSLAVGVGYTLASPFLLTGGIIALGSSPLWGSGLCVYWIYGSIKRTAEFNQLIYHTNISDFIASLEDTPIDNLKKEHIEKIFRRYYKYRKNKWEWDDLVNQLEIKVNFIFKKKDFRKRTTTNLRRFKALRYEFTNEVCEYFTQDSNTDSAVFRRMFIRHLNENFEQLFKDNDPDELWEPELIALTRVSAQHEFEDRHGNILTDKINKWFDCFAQRALRCREQNDRCLEIVENYKETEGTNKNDEFIDKFQIELLRRKRLNKIDWSIDNDEISLAVEEEVTRALDANDARKQYRDLDRLTRLQQKFNKKSPDFQISKSEAHAQYKFQKALDEGIAKIKSKAGKQKMIELANKILSKYEKKYDDPCAKLLSEYDSANRRIYERNMEIEFLEFLRETSIKTEDLGDFDSNLDILDDQDSEEEIAKERRDETRERFDNGYTSLPDDPLNDYRSFEQTCPVCKDPVEFTFQLRSEFKNKLYCCEAHEDSMVVVPAGANDHILSVCGHAIHRACLEDKKNIFRRCPTCRASVPFDEDNPKKWKEKYGFAFHDDY